MLFRTQVRQTALKLIQDAFVAAGANTLDSSDVPVPSGTMPTVILYTDDHKLGVSTGGAATFETTVVLTIEMLGEGDTQAAAIAQAENLNDVVEQALFGKQDFTGLFEKFDRVTTTTDYRGTENRKHIAFAVMVIEAHATEIFNPVIDGVLTGLNIYVDAVNVFDPNGTYTPPFGYTVAAAPRTAGPDGRVEIAAKVDTPTS